MLELLPEAKDNLIAVKVSGKLTLADYERFLPDIADRIADAAPVLAYLDWQAFEGWETDAEWYSFWVRVTNRHAFQRVAIVADESWDDEVARIRKVLDRGEVRRFELADRAAAWTWLSAD